MKMKTLQTFNLLRPRSWSFPRFVPMSTAQQQLNKLARRATLDSQLDSELEPTTESTSDSIILPELIGHSELLTQQRMYCLLEHLPGRAMSSAWQLIFSTSLHGFSVSTMFRNMIPFKDKPVLLIIECTKGSVFGAILSHGLHTDKLTTYYGTGETFLYTFHPDFEVFKWSGVNTFFIKSGQDYISIGGGDGRYGLWLDSDLNRGTSTSCTTFMNPRLSATEDFVVKQLECWGFV